MPTASRPRAALPPTRLRMLRMRGGMKARPAELAFDAVQEGQKHGWDHGEQGTRQLTRPCPSRASTIPITAKQLFERHTQRSCTVAFGRLPSRLSATKRHPAPRREG